MVISVWELATHLGDQLSWVAASLNRSASDSADCKGSPAKGATANPDKITELVFLESGDSDELKDAAAQEFRRCLDPQTSSWMKLWPGMSAKIDLDLLDGTKVGACAGRALITKVKKKKKKKKNSPVILVLYNRRHYDCYYTLAFIGMLAQSATARQGAPRYRHGQPDFSLKV